MLCSIVHHLGGSRKSAREVGASRLFCFTAGFSGSPNGSSLRRVDPAQFPCISRLISDQLPCFSPSDPNNVVGPPGVGGQHWVAGAQTLSYEISYGNDP